MESKEKVYRKNIYVVFKEGINFIPCQTKKRKKYFAILSVSFKIPFTFSEEFGLLFLRLHPFKYRTISIENRSPRHTLSLAPIQICSFEMKGYDAIVKENKERRQELVNRK
jgi:hypothetical protein